LSRHGGLAYRVRRRRHRLGVCARDDAWRHAHHPAVAWPDPQHLILYLDQTPLHEACHGNIAGKDSNMLWLNHLVGYVCGAILLHEYKAFRYMHLAHHRDTNDTEIDPDHWVAVQRPFRIMFRCFTIVFWYHQYFWKHIAFHAHIP